MTNVEILLAVGIIGILLLSLLGWNSYKNEGNAKTIANAVHKVVPNSNQNKPWLGLEVYDAEERHVGTQFSETDFLEKIRQHFDISVANSVNIIQDFEEGTTGFTRVYKIMRPKSYLPIYLETNGFMLTENHEKKYTREVSGGIINGYSLHYNINDECKIPELVTNLTQCIVREIPVSVIHKIDLYGSNKRYIASSAFSFTNIPAGTIEDAKRAISVGNLCMLVLGPNQVGKSVFTSHIADLGFPGIPAFELDLKNFRDSDYIPTIEQVILSKAGKAPIITISLGQSQFRDLEKKDMSLMRDLTEWMSSTELHAKYKINFIAASHENIEDIPASITARLTQVVNMTKFDLAGFQRILATYRPETQYRWETGLMAVDAPKGFTYTDMNKYAKLI